MTAAVPEDTSKNADQIRWDVTGTVEEVARVAAFFF